VVGRRGESACACTHADRSLSKRKKPKPETCQKTRRLPTIHCMPCWAHAFTEPSCRSEPCLRACLCEYARRQARSKSGGQSDRTKRLLLLWHASGQTTRTIFVKRFTLTLYLCTTNERNEQDRERDSTWQHERSSQDIPMTFLCEKEQDRQGPRRRAGQNRQNLYDLLNMPADLPQETA
jgi:hypothetical protein